VSAGNGVGEMMPSAEACERVLHFLRVAGSPGNVPPHETTSRAVANL